MINKPWEKRLKDLAHILNSCAESYFDPELFRINLNHFLTTSRTVTFLIQKNKSNINDFENWYGYNVLDKWKNNSLMTWAKNSRNSIEKEGDLDIYSDAKCTLIFSYVEEQDIILSTKNFLFYGVKKLIRHAQKNLPTGVTHDSAIKIERRWVANTLKDFELLNALSSIYLEIYEACDSLSNHLKSEIDKSILKPIEFQKIAQISRQIRFFKLSDMSSHTLKHDVVSLKLDPPPDYIRNIDINTAVIDESKDPFERLFLRLSETAFATFNAYGYHVPMLFLFNEKYQIVDFVSTKTIDQADKYIFWRNAAERAIMLQAKGFVWISELWLRGLTNNRFFHEKAIKNLPITGEKLQVIAADINNMILEVSWDIKRDNMNNPTLIKCKSEPDKVGKRYFMRPILKAIGADYSHLNS